MTADLTDTAKCPLGPRCESCGMEAGKTLSVKVCESPLGPMCLTLCRACARSPMAPPVTVTTAERLVKQHAGHAGLTEADVAALLELNWAYRSPAADRREPRFITRRLPRGRVAPPGS